VAVVPRSAVGHYRQRVAFAALVGGEQAAGWLRTTARNLALNHVTRYRRRFSFLSFGSGAGERDLAASADDEAEWLYDRVARVKQALLELPRKFRLPLVLYYYEDMDYARIAAALGVSLAKVKTDIMRGRRRLRQLVDRLEETDGATASSGA